MDKVSFEITIISELLLDFSGFDGIMVGHFKFLFYSFGWWEGSLLYGRLLDMVFTNCGSFSNKLSNHYHIFMLFQQTVAMSYSLLSSSLHVHCG